VAQISEFGLDFAAPLVGSTHGLRRGVLVEQLCALGRRLVADRCLAEPVAQRPPYSRVICDHAVLVSFSEDVLDDFCRTLDTFRMPLLLLPVVAEPFAIARGEAGFTYSSRHAADMTCSIIAIWTIWKRPT
jgi:hypothetical protein